MKKIIGVYHIACMNHYLDIVCEQLDILHSSGLYNACNKLLIYISMYNDDSTLDEKITERDPDNKFLLFKSKKNLKEKFALDNFKEHISDEDYMFYFHTKGVSRVNSSRPGKANKCYSEWRTILNHYTIDKWRINLKLLEEFTAVGCFMTRWPVHHFSGNFWWCNISYIMDLPDCKNHYLAPEMWLGANFNNNFISLSNEHINNSNMHVNRSDEHILKNVTTCFKDNKQFKQAPYFKKYYNNKRLTFLMPRCGPRPISGGFRTLFRMMNFMIENDYTVSIEHTGNENESDTQREYYDNYGEIKDINTIEIMSSEQDTSADIYVATGFNTFRKAEYYKSKNKRVVFFCQDLEWKFPQVSKDSILKNRVKEFYAKELPTFTMSNFLGNYFKDSRYLKSTTLNVDTDIYYNQSRNRSGICLLYCNPMSKPHRLPELVLSLAESLAKRHPDKTVSLYGHNNIPYIDLKNVKRLNLLNNNQLAELYNVSELGVVFSTTNPSRIAYEMVACGMPAIEADCEYTKYDMDNDAFVRINPDHDTVINTIDDLLSDPKEMKRLQAECEIYSKNNFFKNAEELRFLNFIEGVLRS